MSLVEHDMGIYDFLEFRHLASIVSIVEHGTFTAAAPPPQHRAIRAESPDSRAGRSSPHPDIRAG